MVARVWHGATNVARSDEYLELMRTVALPDYKGTPGNLGAYVLHRLDGGVAHFYMLTFWESRESVKAFAGDDIGVAKYYDFDEEMLLELEPDSRHYDVYRK